MLIRLIYASLVSGRINTEDIEQILAASRRNNLVDGVTGMLCHGNSRFLQCLEGDEAKVDKIYSRIAMTPGIKILSLLSVPSLKGAFSVSGAWDLSISTIS